MAKASNKFALWLAIGRIISMLVVFAMPLIMTRFLSQSDYGVFSQYFTLYMALNVIFALGFHSNLFYFYPTATDIEKDEYVSNTLFLLLSMSALAILFLNIPFLESRLFGDGRLKEYSSLVTASIALAIPMNIVSPLLTVREDKWGAILYPGMSAILRVGTVTLTALFSNNLHSIFIALVIYQALILGWILVYTLRKHRITVNKQKAIKQIVYSLPFGFTVALQMFSNYFDKIVCISYLTEIQYAIYGTAFLSIPGINQIYESLCQVNVVNMTRSFQSGSITEVSDLYKDFVVKTLSFSTPIILAASLYAEEIIGLLYPAEYITAAKYFRIYSLTFLTYMLGAGTILRAIGKTQYSLISYAISSAIGIPLTYLLIKNYSITGAIIGAVLNIVLPRFIQMAFEANSVKQSFSGFLPWKQLFRILGYACIFLIPLIIIKQMLHPSIIWCILESFIYVLVLYGIYLYKNTFILTKRTVMDYLYTLKSHFIRHEK